MTSLQAQSRTAACPLLINLSPLKVNHDASCKTCTVPVLRSEILCRYSIPHLMLSKNPNNTQNQNHRINNLQKS